MMSWPWMSLLAASVIGLGSPGLLLLVSRAVHPPGWRVLGTWLTTDPTRTQARLTGALYLSWGVGLSALLVGVGTASYGWPSVLGWAGPAIVAAAVAALVTFRLAADLDAWPAELYTGLAWLTGVASAIGIVAAVLVVDRIGWSRYAVMGLAVVVASLVWAVWNSITTSRRNAAERQGPDELDPDDQEPADAAAHVERMTAMENIAYGVVGIGLAVIAVVRFLS
jgi:predicted MFS family arabinose efflux permease